MRKESIKILFSITMLLFLLSPFFIQAEETGYSVLAPIKTSSQEYVKTTESTNDLSAYLDNMFKLGIALCTGLAVLMIIIGGIQYVSSDAWSKKTDGKDRIVAALFGLLIALGSYALLKTINPALLKTKLILQEIEIEGIPTSQLALAEAEKNELDHNVPGGTEHQHEGPQTPLQVTGPCNPNKLETVQDYINCGRFNATDKGGHEGDIDPRVAYMKDHASELFPGLAVYSDYRSPAYNATVPGAAKNSDHTHGNATDIWNPSTHYISPSEAQSVINYFQSHPELGAKKLIYNDRFYYQSNGQWISKQGNYGHQNHVHVSYDG
jgi:hypothetical protein